MAVQLAAIKLYVNRVHSGWSVLWHVQQILIIITGWRATTAASAVPRINRLGWSGLRKGCQVINYAVVAVVCIRTHMSSHPPL